MAHCSAARAAVENLMRVLATEWARFGIRCNAIAAGQFATDTLLTKYPQPIVDAVAGTIPLGRLGEPDELAWLVAYLASPAGDFVSGAVLTVDGARDNWLGPWPPAAAADADGKTAGRAATSGGEHSRPRLARPAKGRSRSVSRHAFTLTQAGIVTSAKVRGILGDDVADRVNARFEQQSPDDDGTIDVDLGDDELAVIAALREISPDAEDSTEQQATETLLKSLASHGDADGHGDGDRDGPA